MFDNPIDRGQAQARALAFLFGGVEGLKDMFLSLFIYPAARIANSNHYVRACLLFKSNTLLVEIVFVQIHVGCLNDELPSIRHGVPGIDDQVHEDLLDGPPIPAHGPQVVLQPRLDLDSLPDEAFEHFAEVFNGLVDVHRDEFHRMFAGK